MWYRDLKFFHKEQGFVEGVFCVEDGKFKLVLQGEEAEHVLKHRDYGCEHPDVTSLAGALVLPGLVDIHVHGAAGADFSDGDEAGLREMARYLASRGITSFLPTSMTLPRKEMVRAFRTAASINAESRPGEARILGIHMEGPFLSEQKRGSQGKTNLRDPDGAFFRELQEICGGMIRIVDVAPELPGALQFCQEASKDCTVSTAHTAATYEQARRLYEAGASHLTHLFNAMTPFHHRAPGVIGAASEKEKVTAELIADNHHVHPSAVRMAFRMFPERICLVSDALRCCGMPEGEYELAGQLVQMQDGVARMLDGTIAGAASDLMEDLRNVIIYGIPIRQAINAATIIPARAAGWSNMVGSIEEGKYADLLICDPGLAIRQVMIGGEYI